MYVSTQYPTKVQLWRERLSEHRKEVSKCPTSLHDVTFLPMEKRDLEIMEAGKTEDAAAGMPSAWDGPLRTFEMPKVKFKWGPMVRSHRTPTINGLDCLLWANKWSVIQKWGPKLHNQFTQGKWPH
jgi:hypothetical protein